MSEKMESSLLTLSSAPHVKDSQNVTRIMWMVVAALLPVAAYSVYLFGLRAFLLLITGIVAAVLAEWLFQAAMKKKIEVMDGSAVITGILVAMNVPPSAPLWMVGIGSFFAIIIVKQLFGGLGFNIFNPALAARAFMLASWPVHMTTGWYKFNGVNVLAKGIENSSRIPEAVFDVISGATPLSVLQSSGKILSQNNLSVDKLNNILFSPSMMKSLFFGNVGGCIGETSAFLILIGGLFLLLKRVITWHIPVSFIGSVGVFAFLYYWAIGYPGAHMVALSHVLSGGLFLGAFFMATDMVTSPVSAKGMIIFGVMCGAITFIIRVWGGYPEGVSYSILLMNAVVPLIDRFTKPKVFGT